jgi:hypothetical protein
VTCLQIKFVYCDATDFELLRVVLYPHHDGDTFPPPSSHFVADGNQVKNSPSDVDAEEDWFDDAQLEEAVKRDPSKVKSLEALSLEVSSQSSLTLQTNKYIYRDYHGSNLNILMELSQ